jgi:hypothetical protein
MPVVRELRGPWWQITTRPSSDHFPRYYLRQNNSERALRHGRFFRSRTRFGVRVYIGGHTMGATRWGLPLHDRPDAPPQSLGCRSWRAGEGAARCAGPIPGGPAPHRMAVHRSSIGAVCGVRAYRAAQHRQLLLGGHDEVRLPGPRARHRASSGLSAVHHAQCRLCSHRALGIGRTYCRLSSRSWPASSRYRS